jgi:hypothetical protein
MLNTACLASDSRYSIGTIYVLKCNIFPWCLNVWNEFVGWFVLYVMNVHHLMVVLWPGTVLLGEVREKWLNM